MATILKFRVENEPIHITVEKVAVVGEGAYERGYAAGEAEGYEKGHTEGMTEGYNNGYTEGHSKGEVEGYIKGQNEGYEQGKTDAIENLPNGYLKIDPLWTSWLQLFNGRPSMAQNLKYRDSANVTTMQSAFQGWTSSVGAVNAVIPSLDLRKVTSIHSMFLYSAGIVEIGEMEIPSVTATNTAFNGCSNLERISFVPNCIKVSIGFPSSSKLNDASVQSIIDGLADLRGQTQQKISFHTDVLLKLTDEQIASIRNKNWTI